MSDKPDNPFKFWEELKRRKVVRVIIGYAAAAFVIIELTNNITEPLNLPDWVPTLVIVLLAIGFLIAIVMSWIFDVTPQGIKKTESAKTVKGKTPSEPVKRKFKVSDAIIAVLLVAVIILAYPRVFNKDKFEDIRNEDGKISIAVMPFINTTNDTLLNIWQYVIQDNLITNLSDIDQKELSVRQFQTTYELLQGSEDVSYASITSSVASDISRKLDVNTFIQGRIMKDGDIFKINAQLVDSKTGEIYKSFKASENSDNNVYNLTTSLSEQIGDYFQIKIMSRNTNIEGLSFATTKSPEAFRYYLKGIKQFYSYDFRSSIESFNEVSKLDSNMSAQYIYLIGAHINLNKLPKAKQLFDEYYSHKDDFSDFEQAYMNVFKGNLDKKPNETIKSLKQLLEEDTQQRTVWYTLGYTYSKLFQYEDAIEPYKKVLELDSQWGAPWKWSATYTRLGEAYHEVGNHKRENEIYELGLSLFPEDRSIIYRQTICAVSRGDKVTANELIEKFLALQGEIPEHLKMYILGNIYDEAKNFEKSNQYYRQTLEINPDYALAMNDLALNLFDQNNNIEEGIKLINQALEIFPESSRYQRTKNWGLFKQGNYSEEALKFLEKLWDSTIIYNHQLFLDIQEVKQAIATKKSEQ